MYHAQSNSTNHQLPEQTSTKTTLRFLRSHYKSALLLHSSSELAYVIYTYTPQNKNQLNGATCTLGKTNSLLCNPRR
jgi:hypothetical protein